MPPISRYWLVYVIAALVVAAFPFGAVLISTDSELTSAERARSYLLLLGVFLGGVTIVANSWSQWRTASVAHAMDALQTLRTDREYLINVHVVTRQVPDLGRPLSKTLRHELARTDRESNVDAPSFRNASLFVLNQYEFLAAGIRSGAIDYKLVETTLRGPIVALVGTYAGQINEMRETKPAVFANLLWLYRRFRQMPPFDRGPIP